MEIWRGLIERVHLDSLFCLESSLWPTTFHRWKGKMGRYIWRLHSCHYYVYEIGGCVCECKCVCVCVCVFVCVFVFVCVLTALVDDETGKKTKKRNEKKKTKTKTMSETFFSTDFCSFLTFLPRKGFWSRIATSFFYQFFSLSNFLHIPENSGPMWKGG